jgi:hypothetical protein
MLIIQTSCVSRIPYVCHPERSEAFAQSKDPYPAYSSKDVARHSLVETGSVIV